MLRSCVAWTTLVVLVVLSLITVGVLALAGFIYAWTKVIDACIDDGAERVMRWAGVGRLR